MIGTLIGHYRITAKLGEGGMGAVYRATDTKLNRDVAVKVIPESFAADSDRLARFTREAQVLASLNHTNIAAIYGVEERALVLELVEGAPPTGPLPLDRLLPLALQIVDALEAAHERGVVHRDLKPANILVTANGVAKVLDFGLAKAMESTPAPNSNPANSPTLTMRATEAGLIMGTAAYMSPEQARGARVDHRTDIWAFGVVIYELAAGRTLFDGESVSDILAAVLRGDIPLEPVPAELRPLLSRCLERDVRKRLGWIGDARNLLNTAPTQESAPPAISRRQWIPWAIAGAGAAAGIASWLRRVPVSAETYAFQIQAPGNSIISPTLSPDGTKLAFISVAKGKRTLYVRYLDRAEAVPLPGADQAGSDIAWGPDSARIAFRTPAAGGRSLSIIDLRNNAVTKLGVFGRRTGNAGIVWGEAGFLLAEGEDGRIVKIAETGGAVTPAFDWDTARGETDQSQPAFFPGGKLIRYLSRAKERSGMYTVSVATGQRVFTGPATEEYFTGWNPEGKPVALFRRGNQILAQPFDPDRGTLQGEERLVASGVATTFRPFTAGGRALAYLPERPERTELHWYTRDGGKSLAATLDFSGPFRISPDETRLVAAGSNESAGLWILDLTRGGIAKLAVGVTGAGYPIWSSDGRWIAFGTGDSNRGQIWRKAADGTGKDELVLEMPMRTYPMAWMPDGKWLLFRAGRRGNWNHYFWEFGGGGKPVPFLMDKFDKVSSAVSPDGQWIAYSNNDSGRQEIYVQPRPEAAGGARGAGGKWQVSNEGGNHPSWRRDGREIYYIDQTGTLSAVAVETNAGNFRAAMPQPLLKDLPVASGPTATYVASRDGKRFLVAETDDGGQSATVIVNWK